MKRIPSDQIRGWLWAGLILLVAQAAVRAAPVAPSATLLAPIQQLLASPSGVVADSSGRVFVSDSGAGSVSVFDPAGGLVQARDGFAGPAAIALGPNETVYVAEVARGRVSILGGDLAPNSALGSGDGEFDIPASIVINQAASGVTVFVADKHRHRVAVYRGTAPGTSFGTYGKGPGQFDGPAGMCLGLAGELYVVDQNNDRVQVFTQQGTYVREFTLKPPGMSGRSGRSEGICIDGSERLYVADVFQGQVRVYASSGQFLGSVSGYGSGAGQLASPVAVSVDSHGRLVVASRNSGKVERFGLDCFVHVSVTPGPNLVANSTATLTAVSGCGQPLSFRWRKGTIDLVDEGAYSGATNATLTIAGVTAANAGQYSVRVDTASGVVVSSDVTINLVGLPVIVRQPASVSTNQGATVKFDVLAQGQALSYQWRYKGIPIGGATTSALRLTAVKAADAGSYTVLVTNLAGTVTSAAAALTVASTCVFAFQPEGQTVKEWGVASLSGAASGTAPVSYQWYFNGNVMAGKTATTLSLSNVNPTMAGNYFLVAANVAGRATSQVAVITVIPDTISPLALAAVGGRFTNRTVTLSFSKAVNVAAAQTVSNYKVFGPGGLFVSTALVNSGTNVVLTLNRTRNSYENYTLQISNVRDTAYTPNTISPNPTLISIGSTLDLIANNTHSWKFLQVNNAQLDSVPWKQSGYGDATWPAGYGIFFGHRTNSVFQPNPNPNVVLPLTLNSSDAANSRAYTILNVFTNAGNVLQEITYYFRTRFNLPAETNGAKLFLRSMIDDGAVVYLNGAESTRIRMPSAPTAISYSTTASSSGSQSWSPSMADPGSTFPLNGLLTGTNVVAVELHQRNTTNDDVTFGMVLEAQVLRFTTPPRITATRSGSALVISWDDPFYGLQSAPDLAGPWTAIQGGSPVNVPLDPITSGFARFFRLRKL